MSDGDWPEEEDSVVLAVDLGAALEVRQLEGDLLALVRHHLLYHNHPEGKKRFIYHQVILDVRLVETSTYCGVKAEIKSDPSLQKSLVTLS